MPVPSAVSDLDQVASNNSPAGSEPIGPDLDAYLRAHAAIIRQVSDASNVGTQTHAATSKATPVDADELPLADSAASFALKKLSWANLKAAIKTFLQGGMVMAGTMTLFADPTSAMDAATKQYVDAVAGSSGAAVQGAFSNLKVSASGTGASVAVTADEIVVENASNKYKTLRAVSQTINTAASGANGLDTGTLAASTWYALFVIAKDDGTTAGLISTSATSPTLPAGYTHKARVGWIRTDGTANKYPLSFIQYGRRVRYKVAAGSNVTRLPIMASGALGNVSTPTWSAVGIGSFAPTTAAAITVFLENNAVSVAAIVAPNNSYGGAGSTTNPPPITLNSSTNGGTFFSPADLLLESTSIYYASNGAANYLFCYGWEDNL